MCRLVVVCLLAVTLAACASTRSPKEVVNANGLAFTPPTAAKDDNTNLFGRFATSAKTASAISGTANDQVNQAKMRALVDDGTALVHATCGDFFKTAGETQTWLIFSKDATAAVSSVVTGLLTLHGASKNTIADLAFGSTAIYAGIDTYTKDFLFAAENVESIRELTMRALDAHKKGILTALPTLDYGTAITLLQDNQDVCAPRNIARLAKAAIASGQVTAATSPDEDLQKIDSQADDAVFRRLGDTLGLSQSVSSAQATALYWLLVHGATATEQTKLIAPVLLGIPPIPFASDGKEPPTYTYTPANWNSATQSHLGDLLKTLSAGRQKAMEASILAAQSEGSKKATVDTVSLNRLLNTNLLLLPLPKSFIQLKVNGVTP